MLAPIHRSLPVFRIGFNILDASIEPPLVAPAPFEVNDIHTPGDGIELDISGVHAYTADGESGLSVVELFTAW